MSIAFRRTHLLTLVTGALCVLIASSVLHGQAPPPPSAAPAARQAPAANRLPIRRVVLYKSGVGYFEHLGQVRGNQNVTIDFTSGQLDDVLKSLTSLDLDGGRVTGVSYNTEAALDRRLGALRLPVGQETTRAQFLSALRGARLEVTTASGARVVGRLLSVEHFERRGDTGDTVLDGVTVVSDGGDIRTIVLEPGVNVRIVDGELNQEVGRYLSLVASVRDQDLRRLTIATAGTGDRDLFVSYISEVPVWKATYRLVLPAPGQTPARRPLLQGWAIVDNTVGEDWENVELSLVAGAPQSFIQRISQPYYVQRPIVPLPERALLSPQTHQTALGTSGTGALTGTVTDSGGGVIPGATIRISRNGERVGDAVSDGTGRYRLPGLSPGNYDVEFMLSGFRTIRRQQVNVAGGMETVLNAALEIGALSEPVSVTRDGVSVVGGTPAPPPPPASPRPAGGGRGGGVGGAGLASRFAAERIDALYQTQADASAGQLGDLFEYKLKERVTIRKNQSALVPILSSEVTAEKVSLWNGQTGSNRPLRAVWLTNATGLTLDGGTFSVTDGQAFAGEGLLESLKAGEKRLLSYAVDLGVQVDSKGDSVPTQVTRVQINRGLVIQQVDERQRRTYTARNDDSEARELVIEHPARTGWSLDSTIKPAETTAAWHRFRITIAPKTTATFTVDETRPTSSQFAVDTITPDRIAFLVQDKALSPALEAALREVIARKTEIARLSNEISARETEIGAIGRDQDRVRENMKSLKGTSEERQLVQRYVRQLDEQETRLDALRRELAALIAERQKRQTDLAAFIAQLTA